MYRFLVVAALMVAPTAPALDSGPYVPTDAERARWTTFDMKSWSIVLDAYHKDNNRYPEATSFEELVGQVQPAYIRVAPARDAWGNAYSYRVAEDGLSCSLVSAGADGKFEPSVPSEPEQLSDFTEDAVVENGQLVRGWEFR